MKTAPGSIVVWLGRCGWAILAGTLLGATATAGLAPQSSTQSGVPIPRLVSTMNGQARESGKLKVVVVKPGSILQVVDAKTGNHVGAELKLSGPWRIECWRFSPDDTWLAVGLGFIDPESGANVGRVGLWDLATGKLVKEFQRDDDQQGFGGVTDVAFAKSGELFYFSPKTDPPPRLAEGNIGQGCRESDRYKMVGSQVADKATGERLSPELVYRSERDLRDWTIACWAFSPDNKWVASGSGYVNGKLPESLGKIDLWEVGTWRHVATMHGLGPVWAVAFSKDGKEIYYLAHRRKIDGK